MTGYLAPVRVMITRHSSTSHTSTTGHCSEIVAKRGNPHASTAINGMPIPEISATLEPNCISKQRSFPSEHAATRASQLAANATCKTEQTQSEDQGDDKRRSCPETTPYATACISYNRRGEVEHKPLNTKQARNLAGHTTSQSQKSTPAQQID